MNNNDLNICQVSLNRDIPIIIENFENLKKIYQDNLRLNIICPENQLDEFKQKLNFKEVNIINENHLISFNEFTSIFDKNNSLIDYKDQFRKRLNWYYQQVLKITFSLNFILKNKKKIVIWDADTVILNKIDFFRGNLSRKYGNFFEFHKAYYLTNKNILKKLPNYFISFLNQFIAISEEECVYIITNYIKNENLEKVSAVKIANLVMKSIFITHKDYNGSMFSEYELIGQANYILKKEMQKPLLFLRFGLDGKLTNLQKKISILLGYKHVTYEHSHPNSKSEGMLNRNQSWFGFFKIIFKNFFKFYLRYIRHLALYKLSNIRK